MTVKIIIIENHEGPLEFFLANEDEVNDAVAELDEALNDPNTGMDADVRVVNPTTREDFLEWLRTS